jgi:transposase
MTTTSCITSEITWVAIDIAKKYNEVLVERPGGKRRHFRMANKKEDYRRFRRFLEGLSAPPIIGFEATGNYHRPLAFFLNDSGFDLRLISSVAAVELTVSPR